MNEKIRQLAFETLDIEGNSILKLKDYIDESFIKAVEAILHSKGRLVVTGIGKSAIIGNKIVATLNSTGTPAIFMHAADAIHGDLGIIQGDDIVLALSKSGNTPEIKNLIPSIKAGKNKIIGMVGNSNSYLAAQSDFILNTTVEKEACPNNLAPTSSSTAQLVMGDALAVCLLKLREFGPEDFAKYHPGGALGKKLYLKVSDIYPLNPKPAVGIHTSLKEVIMEISKNRMGATAVTDEQQQILGIITDGDLRRMLAKDINLNEVYAEHIYSPGAKQITPDSLAAEALQIMQEKKINQLLVSDSGTYLGMVHIQDLLKEGIF